MHDEHKAKIAKFYNDKRQDLDFLLAQEDLIIHHHEGILDEERFKTYSKLASDEEIMPVIHQLESELTEYGMNLIEPHPTPEQLGFDAGCGRGGSSLMIARRFGCNMIGVTLSSYQAEIANQIAKQKGLEDKVKFETGDMTKTNFSNNTFDFVWAWGSTEYADDLDEMFKEFNRVAKPDASLLIITWLRTSHPQGEDFARQVDKEYMTTLHTREQYNKATEANGWKLEIERDHTTDIGRYWELRSRLSKGSGTEGFMNKGFNSGALEYYLFRYRKAK